MTLGIDIGGTTISFGLVEDAKVVRKICVPSFPAGATLNETIDYLSDQMDRILVPEVERIGIGVPSIVDPDKGIVYGAMNIPSWDVVPLKERLENRFGIPVFVNNDANCYALGAAELVRKPARVLVCVTLGTGTGVGIVHEGRIFAGTHCGAGEIGALPHEGTIWEAFCSKQFFTGKGLDCKAAAQKAEAGDDASIAVFREFGRYMGEFLSLVMLAYDPDCIVLGGGVAHSFPLFQASMWEALRNAFPYTNVLDEITIEPMPNADVALVGAAALS